MPKDSTKKDNLRSKVLEDNLSVSDIDLDDTVSEETDSENEEAELDNLSEDVKDALGLDEDGEVKPKVVPIRGKKVVKETVSSSDWLPDDDAKMLEHIDSLY